MSILCQQHTCDCAYQPICAWLHSLRLAENMFSFRMVLFALRQLSHWKHSVQIFSWWRTHILCISRPQWMHSTILWEKEGMLFCQL